MSVPNPLPPNRPFVGQSPRRVGELLLERALITQEQLDWGLEQQKQTHQPLGQVLVAAGHVEEKALAERGGLFQNRVLVALQSEVLPPIQL